MTLEEQIERKDRLNTYKAALQGSDRQTLVAAINEIRNDDITEIIPDLIAFLSRPSEKELHDAVYTLFDELKLISAIPAMMESIGQCADKKVQARLIRSCWYNNLNYAAYLPYFVEIFLHEDFETAYDAFTVIENMQGPLDLSTINAQVEHIKARISTLDTTKKELVPALIELLHKLA